jgi:hypothetical protein
LDIPELSAAASVVHVFQAMANNSLLSVGQLCNEGYPATFKIDSLVELYPLPGNQKLRKKMGNG